MGASATYHPPEGEECETSVEHGVPLWAEPALGYCSRRPRPSPMWGTRFVGAREVGLLVGKQKPLGKTPLRGNPSPEMTYLPTCTLRIVAGLCSACVRVRGSASARQSWLGFVVCVSGVRVCFHAANPGSVFGVCVFACALRVYLAFPRWGF